MTTARARAILTDPAPLQAVTLSNGAGRCGCGLSVHLEDAVTLITAAHSMSLDGFIDYPRVLDWLRDGDMPSQINPPDPARLPGIAARVPAHAKVVVMAFSQAAPAGRRRDR